MATGLPRFPPACRGTHLAIGDQVNPISQFEDAVHVMIGDQDANSRVSQAANNLLNVGFG